MPTFPDRVRNELSFALRIAEGVERKVIRGLT
jgi:hypothetical protein